jgi:hypothetical protein
MDGIEAGQAAADDGDIEDAGSGTVGGVGHGDYGPFLLGEW